MSNVIAFEKAQTSTSVVPTARAAKTMTLFIHVKRATMIAHCGNLQMSRAAEQDRVGKSV